MLRMVTANGKHKKAAKKGKRTSKEERAHRPELAPAKEGEERPPALPLNQMKFCTHYAMYFNGAQAVKHAEFNTVAPREYAHMLLTKPDIQANIRWIRRELGDLHFDLSNQLLAQYNAMRNADPRSLLRDDGVLKDVKDWPDDAALLLNGLEVDFAGGVTKVKLESRKSVMDSMNRMLGSFIEKVDHTSGGKPIANATAVINVTVGGKPA